MKKLLLSANFILLATFSFCQSQSQMNENNGKNFQKADQELNTIYRKILKEYSKNTAFINNLKTAQKIWIQLREADLAAKFPDIQHIDYGSVLPMCMSQYKTELTEERIKRLKTWAEGIEEGDVCSGSVKTKSN